MGKRGLHFLWCLSLLAVVCMHGVVVHKYFDAFRRDAHTTVSLHRHADPTRRLRRYRGGTITNSTSFFIPQDTAESVTTTRVLSPSTDSITTASPLRSNDPVFDNNVSTALPEDIGISSSKKIAVKNATRYADPRKSKGRCTARPSRMLQELEALYLALKKFSAGADPKIREMYPTAFEDALPPTRKPPPRTMQVKGNRTQKSRPGHPSYWLLLKDINIKHIHGAGHNNIAKKTSRSKCMDNKPGINAYSWDPSSKECMYIRSQATKNIAFVEPGRVTACKVGTCENFVAAVGDLLKRLDGYYKECIDLEYSGKLAPFGESIPLNNSLAHPAKVIVTLTTVPSRLEAGDSLAEVVKSVLFRQIMQADIVWLAVPRMSRRFHIPYPNMSKPLTDLQLKSSGRFSALQCEDYGPATKLIPAISRAQPNDIVITVDDDSLYMPWVVGNLVKHSIRSKPDGIVAHIGYNSRPGKPRHPNFDYSPKFISEKAVPRKVDFVAGFGAVLYRRRFFFNEPLEKLLEREEQLFDSDESERRRRNIGMESFLVAGLEIPEFEGGRFVDDDYISCIAKLMGVQSWSVPSPLDVMANIIWSQVTEGNALSSGSNKLKNVARQERVISSFTKFVFSGVCNTQPHASGEPRRSQSNSHQNQGHHGRTLPSVYRQQNLSSVCTPFVVEKNVDFASYDLKHISQASHEHCCSFCFRTIGCHGFSYVNGHCWLKEEGFRRGRHKVATRKVVSGFFKSESVYAQNQLALLKELDASGKVNKTPSLVTPAATNHTNHAVYPSTTLARKEGSARLLVVMRTWYKTHGKRAECLKST